jgi:hypothetical protein
MLKQESQRLLLIDDDAKLHLLADYLNPLGYPGGRAWSVLHAKISRP